MLENELDNWQYVELCLALKLRIEDLEKRGCASLSRDVFELRIRILHSRVILIPFETTMAKIVDELASWQVVEICVALKLRARDLLRRGWGSHIKNLLELRQSILNSHVILTPRNSH